MTIWEQVARETAKEVIAAGHDKALARYLCEYNDLSGRPEEILFWELLGY